VVGICEQNTHGESNPEHFSVKTAAPRSLVQPRCGLPTVAQVTFKAPPCPLSVQQTGKTDAENPQVNR
jgi:hypothetical protein